MKRKRKREINNLSFEKKKKRKITIIIPDILAISTDSIANSCKYLNCFLDCNSLINIVTLNENKLELYSNFKKSEIPWITETKLRKEIILKSKPILYKFNFLKFIYTTINSNTEVINILDIVNNKEILTYHLKFKVKDFVLYSNYLYFSIINKEVTKFKVFDIDNLNFIREYKPFETIMNSFLGWNFSGFNEKKILHINYFCCRENNYIFIGGEKKFRIYNIEKGDMINKYIDEVNNIVNVRYLTNNRDTIYLYSNSIIYSFDLKSKEYKKIFECKNITCVYYLNNCLLVGTDNMFKVYNLIDKIYILNIHLKKKVEGIKYFNNRIYLII